MMDSFNRISHLETELVRAIENLECERNSLEKRIADVKAKIDERFNELSETRAKMKTYLEQELGVNTQN